MQTIDTNLLVRFLVKDDPEQTRLAEALLRKETTSGGVWIGLIVLVETTWVLSSAYKFDRKAIAGTVRMVVDMQGVFAEDAPMVRRAVDAFEAGTADFADYVILEVARRNDVLPPCVSIVAAST